MFRTLTPLFTLLLSIGLYFYFIGPQYEEIKGIQAETAKYAEAIAQVKDVNTRLQAHLNKKNNEFDARTLERLDILVPDKVDEVKLLIDLEEMTKKNGMVFGDISLESSEQSASSDSATAAASTVSIERDFSHKIVTFGVVGTYDEFRALLNDIERSLVMMEITDIGFTVSEGDLQQYSITIRSFALNSPV